MGVAKYERRRNPVLAIQFLGGYENAKEVVDWIIRQGGTAVWVGDQPRYPDNFGRGSRVDEPFSAARRLGPEPTIQFNNDKEANAHLRYEGSARAYDWIVLQDDRFRTYTNENFVEKFRKAK